MDNKIITEAVDLKSYLTEEDLSKQWNVTTRTIFNWRKYNNLPVHYFGRSPRYLLDEVNRWFYDRIKKPKK